MKRYQFNKLIRSKLQNRMIREGVIINASPLTHEQYIEQLKNKIIEEANEVTKANSTDSLIIELADVMEVIHAIANASNINMQNIEDARLTKKEINGHFTSLDYINYIEVSSTNYKVIDYLENKDRPYVNEKA